MNRAEIIELSNRIAESAKEAYIAVTDETGGPTVSTVSVVRGAKLHADWYGFFRHFLEYDLRKTSGTDHERFQPNSWCGDDNCHLEFGRTVGLSFDSRSWIVYSGIYSLPCMW